jgi:activator of HSP90 ATPase
MLTIVQQSVELPAPPADLYAMYLDPAAHASFTGGGSVLIQPIPGSEWSAFDGRIHGRVLALTPDRQIVQSWRSFEWQEQDLDSVLILTFSPAGAGTRLDLAHAGVPARLYDTLVAGWPMRYWQPWRAHLESRR